MRLSNTLHFFNLMLASYQSWKEDLNAACNEIETTSTMYPHVWKTKVLMDYCIPVVCVKYYIIFPWSQLIYNSFFIMVKQLEKIY